MKLENKKKIVDAMLAGLKSGIIPWERPWDAVDAQSWRGWKYKGINKVILGCKPVVDGCVNPFFWTFQEAQNFGGLKKGSKGYPVIMQFFKTVNPFNIAPPGGWTEADRVPKYRDGSGSDDFDDLPDPIFLGDGSPSSVASLLSSDISSGLMGAVPVDKNGVGKKIYCKSMGVVFPGDCLNFLPEKYVVKEKEAVRTADDVELDEKQRDIINNTLAVVVKTGAKIYIGGGVQTAFYCGEKDAIYMPSKSLFRSEVEFVSVLLHELTHWTGKRLKRTVTQLKSSRAREELVAEIGASFLASEMGLAYRAKNNLAYIQSWIRSLENNPDAIITASEQAQRACDYILSFSSPSDTDGEAVISSGAGAGC